MLEMERRRLSLNVSMDALSEAAGFADRYYSKALYLDTPSGRQVRWETLQEVADALFPEGFDVTIKPKVGMRLSDGDLRCKIKFAAAPTDRRRQRELMSELGKRGAKARAEIPKARRIQIAKMAAKTQRNKRLQNRLRPAQTM